eukprot:12625057-Alexandrium_andersonii.AAC.1
MARRRIPERWRRLVRAFVVPRWAEFTTPDGCAHRRRLNTGIGVGGPMKPFFAVEALTGGPTPTYVDDLAVLLHRLAGLRRASLA